jgi:hypothetical protein
MSLQLFVHVQGRDQIAVSAVSVPRAGETLWIKTLDGEGMYEVQRVEHQLDRSRADTYGNHDVMLYCTDITAKD